MIITVQLKTKSTKQKKKKKVVRVDLPASEQVTFEKEEELQ